MLSTQINKEEWSCLNDHSAERMSCTMQEPEKKLCLAINPLMAPIYRVAPDQSRERRLLQGSFQNGGFLIEQPGDIFS